MSLIRIIVVLNRGSLILRYWGEDPLGRSSPQVTQFVAEGDTIKALRRALLQQVIATRTYLMAPRLFEKHNRQGSNGTDVFLDRREN